MRQRCVAALYRSDQCLSLQTLDRRAEIIGGAGGDCEGGLVSGVLRQLVDELERGTLKVVDLTQPLGPSTPVIGLPPIFAASPGVTI